MFIKHGSNAVQATLHTITDFTHLQMVQPAVSHRFFKEFIIDFNFAGLHLKVE